MHDTPPQLPEYQTFVESIDPLALPISASALHGLMCGYLCAGSVKEGESYLRALLTNRGDKVLKQPVVALFGVYAISQQQIAHFNFELQLLLPTDDEPLAIRAQAFSEWCEGFTEGLNLAGVDPESLHEEEAQEAFMHLEEFADLDHRGLQISEDDEQALMEISEYARMAVFWIYSDLNSENHRGTRKETAH